MDTYDQETVAVTVSEKDVYYYNPEMEKARLGKVVSRLFEGERVQRHFFVPEGVTMTGTTRQLKEEYSLGPTSDAFSFTDHTGVMDPLIDKGFQIKSLKLMKGGLRMWAVLIPENPLVIDDPIKWDYNRWASHRDQDRLFEAVLITSSIAPGQGITYQFGWFRFICTNGLISEMLGFGKGRYSHISWSAHTVSKFLDRNRITSNINPPIGNKEGLMRASQILAEIGQPHIEETLPVPIRKTLNPLTRVPDWYMDDIREQFQLIIDNKDDDEVSSLDLLNCMSSPLNFRKADGEERTRYFFNTEKYLQPITQLVAFMSLLHQN